MPGMGGCYGVSIDLWLFYWFVKPEYGHVLHMLDHLCVKKGGLCLTLLRYHAGTEAAGQQRVPSGNDRPRRADQAVAVPRVGGEA